jgi:phosphatidylinositol alpha-1,6-mannosyltransferase
MNRVLLVSIGIGIPGGIANLAGSMLTALDTLALDGRLERVDVVTYLDDSDPVRIYPDGRTYHAAGSRIRFVSHFLQALRTGKPDYILFDLIGGARLMRLPIPGLRSTPYAVTVYDAIDLDPEARPHLIPILRNADLVLAISATTSKRVATLIPDHTDAISILSPPVSAARIALWSQIPHRPIAERDPIVLIASRLDADQPGKGHEALLRAWPTVLDSAPSARLVVAGDGTDRLSLENLARSLGLSDTVEFVGFVSDEQLGELFADATVFAMPSRQEGFGIAYAEAMWHGVPCVGSTADAAVDIIDNGRTGLLVPYADITATADALLLLLQDRALAHEFGARGRQVCLERYTPQAYEAQLALALHLAPD